MKHQLEEILKKADREERLTREEIALLLALEAPDQLSILFQAARKLRRRYFEDKVFLYGFLYLSTYCRNNCRFCFYRRSNPKSLRYRRNMNDILQAARRLEHSGVHLIDLTMGEDPDYHSNENSDPPPLLHLISKIRKTSGLPVMVSAGVLPVKTIEELARAGVSWYALYQETFNRSLYSELRPQQSFRERLETKQIARKCGLLIEDGLLCGVGESGDDLAHAIIEMGCEGASQMRAMTFVPQPGTPMAGRPQLEPWRELLVIAIVRLVYPSVLIPASLDVAGLAGLKSRLDAGANVVTSIVPSGMGLAGVAHPTMDIESDRRSPAGIGSVLEATQLRIAAKQDYLDWLRGEQKSLRADNHTVEAQCALP